MFRKLLVTSAAIALMPVAAANASFTGNDEPVDGLCNYVINGFDNPVRNGFGEVVVNGATVECAPEPEPVAMEMQRLVFFDWDESFLTPTAQAIIDEAAADILANDVGRVDIIGHTDTSGSAAYNLALGQRRAESVRARLVDMGVPNDIIFTDSRGENDLEVATPDGVREPLNRRAELMLIAQ
jgi:outer membrane protein OmpA-like peptidoglycan-associated protein